MSCPNYRGNVVLQCSVLSPIHVPSNELMYATQCHCVLKHLSTVNVFWSRINVHHSISFYQVTIREIIKLVACFAHQNISLFITVEVHSASRTL